jgi:hypothetical protein
VAAPAVAVLIAGILGGIAAPKGTPEGVIARLEPAFITAAQSAEFREFAARMGAAVEVRGARDFDQFIARASHASGETMEEVHCMGGKLSWASRGDALAGSWPSTSRSSRHMLAAPHHS